MTSVVIATRFSPTGDLFATGGGDWKLKVCAFTIVILLLYTHSSVHNPV
jgi:hypothetical protein